MGDESVYDAEEGKLWVCCACGKTSENQAVGKNGWDISCFLNSIKVDKDRLTFDKSGLVTALIVPESSYEESMEKHKEETP